MSNLIVPILLFLDGIIFVSAAVFAPFLGFDPNNSWGRFRFVLLFLGIGLFFISLVVFFYKRKGNYFFEKLISSETSKSVFLLGHIWVVISLMYAGFITYGNFTTWDRTTHYYTQLADAFAKGHLYVDREPDQSLLDAADPYEVDNRLPFDDEIWDMSLYKGKLYLYWGPIPALLITPFQLILDKRITDNYLVFFFSIGLLIFNSLIILKLWKRFFPELPAQYAFICIPLVGLIVPILWATSIPNVYEAAIGAGQFFLMAGFYFSLFIFDENASLKGWMLFLAGLCWACAVGSRVINVFSVIFFVLLLSIWIAHKLPKPIRWIDCSKVLIPLFSPLIVGAIIIGWYNWARFESPFEFGLKYQITIFNLNKDSHLIFQPGYFFPNLFVYVLHPYEFISGFPFIRPTLALNTLKELNIESNQFYYAGKVSGLLFAAPFLVLSLVLMFPQKWGSLKLDSFRLFQPYNFVILLLAGSFLLNFGTLLFYFFAQTRFLVDSISQITLLAILGYWQIASRKTSQNSLRSNLFLKAANILLFLTILTSLLLAFSSETNRFETLNPEFFQRINEFLGI